MQPHLSAAEISLVIRSSYRILCLATPLPLRLPLVEAIVTRPDSWNCGN